MSKLSHSHQPTMDIIEIRRLHDEHGAAECWEMLNSDGVTPEEVEKALGADEAAAFSNWCFLNLK